MKRTYAGALVRVDGMRANNDALAGMQPKFGITVVRGVGIITRLALLADDTLGVEVHGVGDVPLTWLRGVNHTAPRLDDLTAWWWEELAAWVTRHGGTAHEDHDALIAEMKRLRGAR